MKFEEVWFGYLVNAYPCHDMDNSDGKASLKRQKSPETTTDTQGMSNFFLLILRVKYSYFEIFIVVNRPYFVPHTIPYNVFKFSTVPPVT